MTLVYWTYTLLEKFDGYRVRMYRRVYTVSACVYVGWCVCVCACVCMNICIYVYTHIYIYM